MRVAIYNYASYRKGEYCNMDLPQNITLGEICDKWRNYFSNHNLKIWKFKIGNWSEPYTGDEQNSFFEPVMTLREYIEFYEKQGMPMQNYVQIILHN